MPKNRMTLYDPSGEFLPVTIEILKGDLLQITQVDRNGQTNIVTFSDRFDFRRSIFDAGIAATG